MTMHLNMLPESEYVLLPEEEEGPLLPEEEEDVLLLEEEAWKATSRSMNWVAVRDDKLIL